MFVELFYPKELRRLVEKYRREGILNETIVKKLRRNIYAGVTACSILLCFLLNELNSYWLVSLFFLALLLIKRDIHKIFNRNIVPYVNGKRIKVKVLESGIWGHHPGCLYAVYELDSTEIYCKYAGITRSYKDELEELLKKERVLNEDKVGFISKMRSATLIEITPYQKGEICFIYQSNLDKSKGMPDIKFFKENYSLTTSVL